MGDAGGIQIRAYVISEGCVDRHQQLLVARSISSPGSTLYSTTLLANNCCRAFRRRGRERSVKLLGALAGEGSSGSLGILDCKDGQRAHQPNCYLQNRTMEWIDK
jgi:hypothetical protein